jgi:hypothetical protein
MKIVSLSSFAIASALLLASCTGNPPKYDQQAPAQQVTLPTSAPATNTSDSPLNTLPANGVVNQGATPTGTTITPVPTTTSSTAQTAAGANPAHGQPGHRCDIPVGAPLNSPAAAQPTAQPKAQPVQITPQTSPQASPQMFPSQPSANTPVAQPAKPGGRINPPHGEPGHDCAVPVGQPLNN